MAFRLPDDVSAVGYRLAAFETVGSTSVEGMSRARAGETGPLWLVTDHQSAGTGRRGSPWQTPRGNLAASLLLSTDLPPAVVAQLGFVAGLALVQALDACSTSLEGRADARASASRVGILGRPVPTPVGVADPALPSGEGETARVPRSGFTLKWPNDVLADGCKLAGILLQTEQFGGRRAVVIGIGVNVVHAPQGLPYRATSLRAVGITEVSANLFGALAKSWLAVHTLWAEGRGFAAVRQAWLRHAAGLGAPVAVTSGASVIRGTFETIDEQGQLVVRVYDGSLRRISAGEVHFGDAKSARHEEMA